MPQALSYPGVYIEEVPSGVRTITGVATSVAAFIGYTARGPVNSAVQIFSFADFERQFGGLHRDSPLSYAVSHFFMNGGGTAWIVRVAAGAAKASVELKTGVAAGDPTALIATAVSEGAWGNGLEIMIDYETASPASLFNLNVIEVQDRNGVRQVVRSETHRNLSMNSFASNYAVDVVRSASNLIRLQPGAAAVGAGTKGTAESAPINLAKLALLGDNARRLAISVDGGATQEFDFLPAGPFTPTTVAADSATIAANIKTAVTALGPAFAGFDCNETVDASGATAILKATSGSGGEKSTVSITSASQRNAAAILGFGTSNGGRESAAAASIRPLPSGTVWQRQAQPFDFTSLATSASLKINMVAPGGTIGTTTTFPLWAAAAGRPTTLDGLRAMVETAIQADPRPAFSGARVVAVDDRIVVVPAHGAPNVAFDFTQGPQFGGGPTDMAVAGSVKNVAAYQLGAMLSFRGQKAGTPGDDGAPPGLTELKGSQAAKTGLYALEDVDLFNILMLPDQTNASLQAEAVAYAKKRRAFALLDLPAAVDTLPEAKAWIAAASTPHDENAAAYFPRILMADPLRDNRIYSFANSGAIAGLYARTDNERGVWKAPAGTAAKVNGAQGLEYSLTDAENGVLNPLGLNAIRSFPVYGNIAWGARTLMGADAQASEWKYIPIRRLALFLEESLYRGTQWVVFEPNDEPLWAQIRLNIGAFLNGLFRQGAFQGKTPKEAYFVKCDRETTTQADINNGIVNIMVGFAPLKPAEFVVIRIQQMAGDIPT